MTNNMIEAMRFLLVNETGLISKVTTNRNYVVRWEMKTGRAQYGTRKQMKRYGLLVDFVEDIANKGIVWGWYSKKADLETVVAELKRQGVNTTLYPLE